MAADSPRELPIPLACPKCGTPMSFHGERVEPDEEGQPTHVRVYFCNQHAFFHFSEREQLTPGM